MAYKFQLGAAKLGGAVTSTGAITGDGIDAGDGDVTNVGSIKLDSIQADVGGDGTMDIILTDNKAAALEVKEGSNLYIRANTANSGGEKVEYFKPIELSGAVSIMFAGPDDAHGINPGSGNLRLSGSTALELTSPDGVVISSLLKMPDNTSGKIMVADGTSFQEVAVSGDVTMDSTGAISIGNQKVTNAMLADDAVGADELASNAVVNASVASNAAIDFSKLASLSGGQFLVGSAGNVASAVSMGGDATMVANGNVSIANDAVTFAKMQNISTARVLGRVSDGSGNTEELSAAQLIGLFNSDLGGNFQIGDQIDDTLTLAGGLTVGGALTVNGTVTTVNSTTINITSSFTFEGPADDFETQLGVVGPTADRVIRLADSAGTLVPFAAAPSAGVQILTTPAELNLLDADTAMETNPVALEASDNFLLFDDSASNAPKRARLQDIVELTQKKGILGYDAASLANDSNTQLTLADANKVVRASSAMGADKTINLILPDIDANNVGEVFMIKAPSDCSSDRKVAIKVKTTTDKIDGVANQIVGLESPNAAITLVVVAADEFAIF